MGPRGQKGDETGTGARHPGRRSPYDNKEGAIRRSGGRPL
jgi:hypothetical protein